MLRIAICVCIVLTIMITYASIALADQSGGQCCNSVSVVLYSTHHNVAYVHLDRLDMYVRVHQGGYTGHIVTSCLCLPDQQHGGNACDIIPTWTLNPEEPEYYNDANCRFFDGQGYIWDPEGPEPCPVHLYCDDNPRNPCI